MHSSRIRKRQDPEGRILGDTLAQSKLISPSESRMLVAPSDRKLSSTLSRPAARTATNAPSCTIRTTVDSWPASERKKPSETEPSRKK